MIQLYSGVVPGLLVEALKCTEWHSLLDLGCGDGALLYALHEAGFLEGREVYAEDLSEKRIKVVSKLFDGIRCFVGDACQVSDIPDGSIDFLVSTQVIEHVSSDEEMVAEAVRVLREGGAAYISTVFKKWYGWYFYRNGGKWVLDQTHVREYTNDADLLELIDRHGLRVNKSVKKHYWFPIVDPVLKRFRGRGYAATNSAMRFLRKVAVPIPGYYFWELLLEKQSSPTDRK